VDENRSNLQKAGAALSADAEMFAGDAAAIDRPVDSAR
jgi:hypothetical protein